MEKHIIYDPEAATNFFEELQDIAKSITDYAKAYQSLNIVFKKCLDQNTNIPGIRFGGPFAQLDYLLKEYKAPSFLRAITNEARVRFRKLNQLDGQTLVDNFWYDFKAVCLFVGFIFHSPVPSILKVRFPEKRENIQSKLITNESLRIIVNRWDNTHLYATADEEGIGEVKVYYGGTSDKFAYKDFNWAYLHSILTPNCQLNIIRPREEDGVLYPELFIFEPDYLVDITAIASCFESYSNSHINHLLNKIKENPIKYYIILGNLASQFLDEALFSFPNDCPYSSSIKHFFKENALSLLTITNDPDFKRDIFHKEAKSQSLIIQNVIHNVLPKVFHNDGIERFDSSQFIVEPSFFSEMLGLQGRMDLLQLDQKILIEQKSGKAGFPEQEPPKAQEKHYVQVILYMMLMRYNYRESYLKNGSNLHSLLFYSKYIDGLIDLSFAPELMFEAIRTRNEIAANEFIYSQGKINTYLENLTADQLNLKKTTGILWEKYQKPQLEQLLSPIHNSSELERAYYFRFLTFLETEHLMAKIGNRTKANSGFADKWHSSLQEKLNAGNIYYDLNLIKPSATEKERVDYVLLKYTQRPDNDISNFRRGDIVVLYPYSEGTEPDARQTMVFRSTIETINEDSIQLYLRNSQISNSAFWHNGKKKWAIEHDFFESSYKSLYSGMHSFLSAPQERKDLLLLQREPRCDKEIRLQGNYNYEEKDFNELVLRSKQAKDLFLIIGPPGTGKTSFGLLYSLKEELLSSQSSVLLLSYTNRAVDEICSKLEEEGIKYIRIGSKFSCDDTYHSSLLSSKTETCQKVTDIKDLIVNTRVFVGTTATFNSNINIFQIKQFSLAIIDEASQILEPYLIGLLSAKSIDGSCAIKKFILIGDHKQLPAVVQQKEEDSLVEEAILRNIHLTNCRLSLFERLLKRYKNDNDVVYMLKKQGRMHHEIAQFPNYTFYKNELKEVPKPHQIEILPKQGKGINGIDDILSTRRIAFVAIPSPHISPSDKVNSNEAEAIAATVIRIYELNKSKFDISQTVGVIVPYRNQIAEIRKAIEKSGIEIIRNITIDTVERYQGSQRDIIIYGFTIQKYYQLDFLTSNSFEEDDCSIDRKLNVALTRARKHLLLFGNPELLANNFTFYKLIEFVRSKHSFFVIELSKYISGDFSIPDLEKDLDYSQATYMLDTQYENAFKKLIIKPIQEDNRTSWPDIIIGRDMKANLDAIGYGRIDFSNQLQAFHDVISPKEQVLLYCYYIMRMHYCSSKSLFSSYNDWMTPLINNFNNRLQFIDVGCGPATCGLAFAEQFLSLAPYMQYIGIDVSVEMKRMGTLFIDTIFNNALRYKMIEAFGQLDNDYWEQISEVPTLVVFNFSYVFSNLKAAFTEQLACLISSIIKKYPLNKFLFFIQHSECDTRLNSYKVFKRIISSVTKEYKKERTYFHYQLNDKERSKEFCYEILSN